MKYKLSSENRGSRFLDIKISLSPSEGNNTFLQLPIWRPGRYEKGNFAKNIRSFHAKDKNGKDLSWKKANSHLWEISNPSEGELIVEYQYYANELNAGSSYVDHEQIYFNPVNCLMYNEESKTLPHELSLEIPEDYEIACGLSPTNKNNLFFESFDHLADTPIIASNNVQHDFYEVHGTKFHLWFIGEAKPNFDRIKKDFIAFTQIQFAAMGEFPFDNYHFLFQIQRNAHYHGVEHFNSTVISLGPSYEIMKDNMYKELLGISSHELFHAWNIKAIRPLDWFPYDFSKECPSPMGYLAEGVTTYLGDLYLKQSKVFSKEDYYKELHKLLDRHSVNDGRLNLSVRDSSVDTWVDGYVKGTPNRKSSIYTEGALLSLCIDIEIITATKGKYNLSTVIKSLYENHYKNSKGVTEADFVKTIQDTGFKHFDEFFNQYYRKSGDYFLPLKKAFEKIGIELVLEDNQNYLSKTFGLVVNSKDEVWSVAKDSPAENLGLNPGDEIIAINKVKCSGKSNDWANYFTGDLTLTVNKNNIIQELQFTAEKEKSKYFNKYRLKENSEVTEEKLTNRKFWLGD